MAHADELELFAGEVVGPGPEQQALSLERMSMDHDDFLENMGGQAFQNRRAFVNEDMLRVQDATHFLNLDNLKALRKVFRKTGHGDEERITAFEFKVALQDIIVSVKAVELIYMNVVRDAGYVTWNDFTTFLLAVQKNLRWGEEQSHLVKKMSKRAVAVTSASLTMIDCVTFSQTHRTTGAIVTANKHGHIEMWDMALEEKLAEIVHKDKSNAYITNMVAGLSRDHRAALARKGQKLEAPNRKTAITCMCLMAGTTHLVVGSADSSVTLYDSATGDVIGRLVNMEEPPTCVDAFLVPVDPHEGEGKDEGKQGHGQFEGSSSSVLDSKPAHATNPHDNFHDIPAIVIGDSAGTVRIVTFPPVFADTSDTGAKKHNKELWKETVGAEEEGVHVMKRLHDDVVRDVRYISDLRMLVTCSNDGLVKLVDIFKHTVREEYRGHSSQDDLAIRAQWCAGGNYLATSGKRQLYLWDPFTQETLNFVKDLTAPIVSHFIDDAAGTLIIGTLDKRITVLDTIDYTILQSFVDATTYRPHNELSALMYLPQSRTLFTAGNGLTRWVSQPIKSVDGGDDWDDSETVDDVLVCLQNLTFKLSIVVTTTGIVSAYNTEDGTMMNCFSLYAAAADDDGGGGEAAAELEIFNPVTGLLQPLVQHALLDSIDRHLIIITRSNAVQYWNFQSGTCVGTMQPAVPNQLAALAGQPFTITCATTMLLKGDTPVPSSENAPSNPSEVAPRRLLMLGTSLSYAVGYVDSVQGLSVDPVSCLSNINIPVDRGDSGGGMGASTVEQRDPFASQTSGGGGGSQGMRDDSMQSASERMMMAGSLDMAVVSAGRASVTSLVAIDDSSGLLAVAYSNGTCSIWNVVSFRRVVVLDMTAFSMQLDGLLRSARRSVFDIAVKMDDNKKDDPVQRRAAPAQPASNTGLRGSLLDHASFIMPHGVPSLPRVASSRNGMKKTRQSTKKRKDAPPQGLQQCHSLEGDSLQSLSIQSFSIEEAPSGVHFTKSVQRLGGEFGSRVGGGFYQDSSVAGIDLFFSVDSVVVVAARGVIIGACTDGMLRFWSLHTGECYCCCRYVHNSDREDLILTSLTLSWGQDVLIGAYSDGRMRLWELDFPALMALESRLQSEKDKAAHRARGHLGEEGMGGDLRQDSITDSIAGSAGSETDKKGKQERLYIAPIRVVSEFVAHESDVVSVFLTSVTDGEKKFSSLQGRDLCIGTERYIVTASKDQTATLWTLDGVRVGSFGQVEWSLYEEKTWGRTPRQLAEDMPRRPKGVPPSDILIWRPRGSIAMNEYVRKMKMRPSQPKSGAQNAMYNTNTKRHPTTDVDATLGDFSADVPRVYKAHKSSPGKRSSRKACHLKTLDAYSSILSTHK